MWSEILFLIPKFDFVCRQLVFDAWKAVCSARGHLYPLLRLNIWTNLNSVSKWYCKWKVFEGKVVLNSCHLKTWVKIFHPGLIFKYLLWVSYSVLYFNWPVSNRSDCTLKRCLKPLQLVLNSKERSSRILNLDMLSSAQSFLTNKYYLLSPVLSSDSLASFPDWQGSSLNSVASWVELSLGDSGGVWDAVETGLERLSEFVTGLGFLKGGLEEATGGMWTSELRLSGKNGAE